MLANGSRLSRRNACRSRPSSHRSKAPKFIALHPATLDRYAETVDALAASLGDHDEAEDDRGPLVRSFRALVHSVTIHPNGPREGFQIEVKGKLAALIGGDPFPKAVRGSGGPLHPKIHY